MSEYEAIERTKRPNTRATLANDLRALGGGPGSPVIVHASLSRLGWTCGGPVAVCQALFDAFGDRATVVMPSQTTEYSDPAHWTQPPVPREWWEAIRSQMPIFDPAVAPTRQMGVIAEAFRSWPGAARSAHPSASFVACGPRAREIVEPHALAPAFGEESPLARLYEMDARVLLLGTEYDACTAMHLAEARWSKAPRARNGAPEVDARGERVWREFEDVKYDSDIFLWIGHDFEKRNASPADVRAGFVGLAHSRLIRMRPLVDHALSWLEKRGPLA